MKRNAFSHKFGFFFIFVLSQNLFIYLTKTFPLHSANPNFKKPKAMVMEDSGEYRSAPPPGRDGHDHHQQQQQQQHQVPAGSSSPVPPAPAPTARANSGLGLSTLGSGLSRAREKVEGVAARMKRIAISAEPSKKVANPKDLNITRIEKSDK